MDPDPKRRKLNNHTWSPSSFKKRDEAVAGGLAAIAQPSSPTLHSSALAAAAAVMGGPSPSHHALDMGYASTSQVSGFVVGSDNGFFGRCSNFSVNNPIMVDNSTRTTINNRSDQRSKAMKHLSKHIIHGAARDSSARSPVPRCHPGTRVEINEDMICWFYDEEKEELLIWVFGPAGVGKSAIMQTLADKLADAQELGASVFISRPNRRNSSRHLFLTVGYQLAVHIEEYYTYITEKLARDPEIVDKGIEEQFKTFIVEPFADKKIGTGLKPRGVLLDGLDELDELQSQKQIIHLVADFVLEHPDVPLLWAISSRPEPHISDTFNKDQVIPSYWSKHVPVDSGESIRDVELFIRDDLDRIRREFPRRVPKEWPSEEQISKLAAAASGLFIFAETTLRFIEDPRYANHTTRLNQVLSALSGPMPPSSSQPFARLDTLYTRVLEEIPCDIWSITKRVLGVLVAPANQGDNAIRRAPATIAVVLGLELTTVHTALNGCYSLVKVSDAPDAMFQPTEFYHASFSDYLLDLSRSQSFSISLGDVEEDLLKSCLGFWEKFKTNHPPTSGLTYGDRWVEYFSTIIPEEIEESYESLREESYSESLREESYSGSLSEESYSESLSEESYSELLSEESHESLVGCFHESLISYIHEALVTVLVEKHDPNGPTFSSKDDQDQCFNLLSQFEYGTARDILLNLQVYHDTLVARGIITAMRLEQFQFSDAEEVCTLSQDNGLFYSRYHKYRYTILHHISHVQSYHPQLPVLFCGSFETGYLLFRHQPDEREPTHTSHTYFIAPIRNSNFYHDRETFLNHNFDTIRAKYPQMVPPTWPSREQLLKLAGAVSHHSVFGSIAIRFIEDPYAAGNPITRLNQLLALIDEVDPSDDHPFIYVDALYTHILDSTSPDMWPTTKQALNVLLNPMTSPIVLSSLRYPLGISVTFGTKFNVVGAALNGCYTMLLTPPADPSERIIFHDSFYEYLMDSTRSKRFSISKEQPAITALEVVYNFWLGYKRKCHGSSNESQWATYCSQRYSDFGLSTHKLDGKYFEDLSNTVHKALAEVDKYGPAGLESPQIQGLFFEILGRLDYFTVSQILSVNDKFFVTLLTLWNTYQVELSSRGLFHEIEFRDLRLDHLEHRDTVQHGVLKFKTLWWFPIEGKRDLHYISTLPIFQQRRPQLQVLIGGMTGGRFAAFEYEYTEDDSEIVEEQDFKRGPARYVIPYPDEA